MKDSSGKCEIGSNGVLLCIYRYDVVPTILVRASPTLRDARYTDMYGREDVSFIETFKGKKSSALR